LISSTPLIDSAGLIAGSVSLAAIQSKRFKGLSAGQFHVVPRDTGSAGDAVLSGAVCRPDSDITY
jgi:hypothetical protein